MGRPERNDVRRLGVCENVEFGCRRPVSVGKSAAHQADARDVRLQLRVSQQQGGNVRQGSRGHDGQRLGAFAQQAGHLLRRALGCGLAVRLRQGRAVQPAHAVHARGGERLGQQRPGKAHRPPAPGCRAAYRCAGRCALFFNGLVPGGGADAADVEAGRGQHPGNGVVMAGSPSSRTGMRWFMRIFLSVQAPSVRGAFCAAAPARRRRPSSQR